LSSLTPEAFDQLLREQLDALSQADRLRHRRELKIEDAVHLSLAGRPLVNFASNNYLGLTHHPRVIRAAHDALATHGLGSGAAPLVTGYTDVHAAAERAIAKWKHTEDAVLLSSGFQANLAAVGALVAVSTAAGRAVQFCLDKLVHASLVDAVRSTGAPFRIFPHNGIAKLRRLLENSAPGTLQIVITESIFSMDGDAADLASLAAIKTEFPFFLLLDEAHGSGVYGTNGQGYAAEAGFNDLADLTIITLSKALGGIGGAICGSKALCDTILNFGRPYIFSTSLPSAIAAAAIAGIEVMRDEPNRQQRVRMLAKKVRSILSAKKLDIPAGDSPIIPIILGDESKTLAAAAWLQEQGLLVVAIRPPTVPRGGSRLRVTLSSDHSDEEVDRLIDSLLQLHASKSFTTSP
jgi:8-amino-7-oxononanoate synthase